MVSKRSDEVVSSQPEEIRIIARVGESITVPTKLMEKKPKKEVDIKNITSRDDLKSIQTQDPFMYYSIPEVRSANVLMRDIDMSNLSPRSQKVSRRTCISFECHPDLLYEDLLNELDGLGYEGAEEPNPQDMDLNELYMISILKTQ